MKFLSVASSQSHRVLLLLAIALMGEGALFVPSSQAVTAATKFVCGKFEGKPATLARTKKGDVPIVIWSSEGFSSSGYKPQVRCQKVSARFQSMYSSKKLKYITAGKVNNIPVVCATMQQNDACTSQNILYTLKPGTDPQQTISRLMQVRNRATSRGIEESASAPTETAAKSIDLDWLEEDN